MSALKIIGKVLFLPIQLLVILAVEIAALLFQLYQWAYNEWGRMS